MTLKKLLLGATAASMLIGATAPSANAAGSAAVVGAIRQFHLQNIAEILAFSAQQLATLQTLGGQLSGNMKEQIAADANMRQLQDERARQREIESVTFAAAQNANSALNEQECRIRTRVHLQGTFNRPDLRISESTREAMLKWGSWRMGMALDDAGNYQPIETASAIQKDEIFVNQQMSEFTNTTDDSRYKLASTRAEAAMLGTVNETDDKLVLACEILTQNIQGTAKDDLGHIMNGQSVEEIQEKAAIFASSSRASLSQYVMLGYCADIAANENADDTSSAAMLRTAQDIPGWSQDIAAGNGNLSYLAGFKIRSQEWAASTDDSTDLTELKALNRLTDIAGWQAYQNGEIYHTLQKGNVVDAAVLGTLSELVELQREQISILKELKDNI